MRYILKDLETQEIVAEFDTKEEAEEYAESVGVTDDPRYPIRKSEQ